MLSKNIIFSLAIFLLVIIIFISRLVELQVSKGVEYEYFSNNLAIKGGILKPARGLILDRDMDILAKNSESYEIEVYNLAKNLDLIEGLNYKIVNNVAKLSNLSNVEVNNIIKNLTKDDFKINLRNVREYRYPNEFSHIIGYTGITDEEDIKKGYSVNDFVGKYKLERQYENELKGIEGKDLIIDGVEYVKQSEPGHNITLTIDKDWQNSLYKIIASTSERHNAAGGAGVIVDDSNGDIIALVSYPGFNTNLFIKGIPNDDYEKLLADRRKPLQDKSIGYAAAPGSTFKLITSYNLLQNDIINGSTNYFSNRCIDLGGGYNFCEYGKFFYGDMNIERALFKSSNLFFCNYSLVDYRQNGYKNIANAAELFNIGKKTGIDLEGEITGIMDSPEYRKRVFNESWYDGDTCNTSIGQGAILTTPLQMAMVASVINNKGVYFRPKIIKNIKDVYGNVIFLSQAEVVKNVPFKEETLRLIENGMNGVAHDSDGTVYVFLNSLPGNVKAKTGTAEVFENLNDTQNYRTHGWIVGSFDYLDKSYSFSFHLSYGGGGFYIAEALRDFIHCLYNDFKECY